MQPGMIAPVMMPAGQNGSQVIFIVQHPPQPPQPPQPRAWRYALIDIGKPEYMSVLLASMYCPCCVYAKNVTMLHNNKREYCCACLQYCCCSVCFGIETRREIRAQYHIKGQNLIDDVMAHCCFRPCALSQERCELLSAPPQHTHSG
ncbi:hypothetical protein BC831DRAFT_135481 [Entophlyctis helioformis]|nr:hypothetical protein BC831DRAFT_135481 [Entophlyctis helioformis]